MTGLPPLAGIGVLFDALAQFERTFALHRDSLEGRLAETEIERWRRFPWERETGEWDLGTLPEYDRGHRSRPG
jgi:hypothetical protein